MEDRILTKLRRCLGETYNFLQDPQLVELMVNADGVVWIERLGEPIKKFLFWKNKILKQLLKQ